MTVDLEERRRGAHREEVANLPRIVPRLHQPARRSVAKRVWRHVVEKYLFTAASNAVCTSSLLRAHLKGTRLQHRNTKALGLKCLPLWRGRDLV